MSKTIANVLTGVAALFIRQPNDAIAEWSEPGYGASPQSAKLLKTGSGAAGSTCVQFIPPAGITLAAWQAAVTDYAFRHNNQNIGAIANWAQFEFKFEDPNSGGWAEVTAVALQSIVGTGLWVLTTLAANTPSGFGGVGETGGSFFDWVLADLSTVEAQINLEANVDNCSDWVLTRVRIELWEPEPARYCYIGEVTIAGVVYTVEHGGTAPGMTLESPFAEVGYTEDGVTIEYTADEADIEVEEETFPIDRVITKETAAVTCNMAESSLYNIDKAMAGSVLLGSKLTLGAGVNKTMNLKIAGTNPAGFNREILIPLATATGAVGMAYKKGEKTVVPVTFQALKGDEPAVTIV
ncbi:MAG: hypothetical protein KAT75_10720, partial [Dehalococcoidia bacterium]|nr:hypothetical protein [Dehalococcoidia bacterium]